MKRIIGIDCGLAIVGWEVMEISGNKFVHIDGGVITTSSNSDTSLRLKEIYQNMLVILEKYKPSDLAIEELFFFKNSKTVISVSEARGVTILAGVVKDLNIYEYTPLQVKVAVTGYGRSEKKQVQFMVQKLLGFKDIPKPDDWADAIAISICHLNTIR